ncbi:MAG: DNA (cytosine-5)-methyltransferase 1 [Salibacteraceae bacterium]|jgi:DNA (cytosine-5)-methyltransferase 1
MNSIDLYSGIGGWTLGMKLSNINNIASYEWWHEANQTHNFNFETTHREIDIRKIDVKHLSFDKNIDFVVGSPPCTQFSYANKGGNGDISDGLVDISKFLEVVNYLKPKYWAMENVPRVAGILEKEIEKGGALHKFKHLVKVIKVVDSADYGVPQNRKRMIAGNFPVDLFDSYKTKITQVTLGEVLSSLSKKIITDPNYGYQINRNEVTELENEASLTPQEERINRDAKTYHPIYNNMSFPDKLNRPSRTVTATCTRVSRESIIVEAQKGFRRLTVRERGVVQGFPITYQFYGRTLNAKFKMIGNAVPPILTYYIFQSMLEVPAKALKSPKKSQYYHTQPSFKGKESNLGLPKRKFPATRKFKFAVPNLRYGSGVRFELSNDPKVEGIPWSFKFYHGNSKNIKEVPLNSEVKKALGPILNSTKNKIFNESIEKITTTYSDYKSKKLQKLWTASELNNDVFNFLDEVGDCVEQILEKASLENLNSNLVTAITQESNKKIEENKKSILTGFYFLSTLNSKIFNK